MGEVIDIVDMVECLFSSYDDVGKFAFFAGMYVSAKDIHITEFKKRQSCMSYSEECTVVQENPLQNIETEDELIQFFEEVFEANCEDFCEGNADFWINEFLQYCDENIPVEEIEQLRVLLIDLCINHCGFENPLGVTLDELLHEIATDPEADPNDVIILGKINSWLFEHNCDPMDIDEYIDFIFDSIYQHTYDEDGIRWNCYDHRDLSCCVVSVMNVLLEDNDLSILCNNICKLTGNRKCVTREIPSLGIDDCFMHHYCTDEAYSRINFTGIGPYSNHKMSLVFYDPDYPIGNILQICNIKRILFFYDHGSTCNEILGSENFIKAKIEMVNGDIKEVACFFLDVANPIVYGLNSQGPYPEINFVWDTCTRICLPEILVDTIHISLEEIQDSCKSEIDSAYAEIIETALNDSIADVIAQYANEFNCLPADEEFTAIYGSNEYHHTLYYYDQAANLVRTVPPDGFVPGGEHDADYFTNYYYNSLNQVILQETPSSGTTHFYYDYAQRLRLSQNAQQSEDGTYSYTKYDGQSRITEVGLLNGYGNLVDEDDLNDPSFPQEFIYSLTEVTKTCYDQAIMSNVTDHQNNLLNRVSAVERKNLNDNGGIITEYSYDAHGNVNHLQHRLTDAVKLDESATVFALNYQVQSSILEDIILVNNGEKLSDYADINLPLALENSILSETERIIEAWLYGMGMTLANVSLSFFNNNTILDINCLTNNDVISIQFKDIGTSIVPQLCGQCKCGIDQFIEVEYDYDLISGNVLEVAYQAGKNDQFFHRYEYDLDNRLINTYTSDDHYIWDKEAHYKYYDHGPLARMEIGNDQIQGMDYYYTLQGWIKGVNAPSFSNELLDPGQDGYVGMNNANFATDEYAFSLGYNEADYAAIDNDVLNTKVGWQGNYDGKAFPLFNGNIAFMLTDINAIQSNDYETGLYKYDQLHRIKEMNTLAIAGKTSYSYDGNGNLGSLTRKKSDGTDIDLLSYSYDVAGQPNLLSKVRDDSNSELGLSTLDHDFGYDKIGNLVDDDRENVKISWNVYGKVDRASYNDGAGKHVAYEYDSQGNRLSKWTKNDPADPGIKLYYLRDASGNTLSTYKQNFRLAGHAKLHQNEVSIYGSSRLGIKKAFNSLGTEEESGDIEKNVWIGPPSGNWHGNSDYWSLGRIPEICDHILIDGATVMIATNQTAVGRILELVNGGVANGNLDNIDSANPDCPYWREDTEWLRDHGRTKYELSNHLGNVLTTVTDQKLYDDVNGYYKANIVSAQHYYPFGLTDTELKYESGDPCNPTATQHIQILGSQVGFCWLNGFEIRDKDGNLIEEENFQDISDEDAVSNLAQLLEILLQNNGQNNSTVSFTYVEDQNNNTADINIWVNDLISCGVFISDVYPAECYQNFNLTNSGFSGEYNGDLAFGTGYRYGFNGKEIDKDMTDEDGDGNLVLDYGFRIYNPAISRFLSVDPLTKSYPWYTPYQFAGNMSIWAIDVDGLEPEVTSKSESVVENGNVTMQDLSSAISALQELPTLREFVENVGKNSYVEISGDVSGVPLQGRLYFNGDAEASTGYSKGLSLGGFALLEIGAGKNIRYSMKSGDIEVYDNTSIQALMLEFSHYRYSDGSTDIKLFLSVKKELKDGLVVTFRIDTKPYAASIAQSFNSLDPSRLRNEMVEFRKTLNGFYNNDQDNVPVTKPVTHKFVERTYINVFYSYTDKTKLEGLKYNPETDEFEQVYGQRTGYKRYYEGQNGFEYYKNLGHEVITTLRKS